MSTLFARGGVRKSLKSRRRRLTMVEALEPRLALSTIVEDDNWRFEGGGMKDLNTGLVWSQSFLERTGSLWSYNGATTQANNLVEGGQSDWRMPTLAELQEAVSHGIANHAFAQWGLTSSGGPSVWSTASCSPGGGKGHTLVELFGGGTSCHLDASGFDAVAVRGSRSVPTYTTPDIRVFSQLVYTLEARTNARFTVALDTQPSANVTLPVSSNDTSEGTASVSQLVFTPTNWNLPQAVTINWVDDAYFDPNRTYQVVLGAASSSDAAYAGFDADDVTAVNREKNVHAVQPLLPIDWTLSEDGSDTGLVSFALSGQPEYAGDVYVDISSLDPTEGTVSTNRLTFNQANWNVGQPVTVYGVADGIADGDQTFGLQVTIGSGSQPDFLAGTPRPPLAAFKSFDMDGLLTNYATPNVNVAIPDPGTVTSSLVVPAPTDGYDRIGDLNVTLNINHTYVGDLTATLISPSGQRIKLVGRAGGSGDNFVNTTFDDEASSAINGAAPFTGTFRPNQSLSTLDRGAVAGTWKLEVNDAVRKDRGTLVNWSLDISRIPAPAMSFSATDEALMLLMAEELHSSNERR